MSEQHIEQDNTETGKDLNKESNKNEIPLLYSKKPIFLIIIGIQTKILLLLLLSLLSLPLLLSILSILPLLPLLLSSLPILHHNNE